MLVYTYALGDITGPNLFTGRFGKPGFFSVDLTDDPKVYLADHTYKYVLISFYHYYIWQNAVNKGGDPYEYGYHQLVAKLHPDILKDLQTGESAIVIDASYENFSYPVVHHLHTLFDRLKIKLGRISIIFPTAHGAQWSRKMFPHSEMKFCGVGTFELEAFQHLAWNRKRRFLMLNRQYGVERAWMFFQAQRAGILNNSHATFGVTKFAHLHSENTRFEKLMKENISQEVNIVYNDPDLAEFILYSDDHSLPYKTTLDLSDKKALDSNYSEFLLAHHNSTHIAMIQESYQSPALGINNTGFDGLYFPTEKTFRTIGMAQPFLVYSAQHFLKYLRNQGYQTFSPFIDESYDDISDDRQRQMCLFNELNRLDKMADHEFNPLMEKLTEIADFNYQHFMGRRNNVLHGTYFEDSVLSNHFQIPLNSG
jgi:hypothetical protein